MGPETISGEGDLGLGNRLEEQIVSIHCLWEQVGGGFRELGGAGLLPGVESALVSGSAPQA